MSTKKTPGLLFSCIVALGFVATAAAVVYFLLAIFAKYITDNPEIGKAIVAGVVAVTIALLTSYLTKSIEHRAKRIQELRERKTPVYERMISLFLQAFYMENDNGIKLEESDVKRILKELTEKMIVWGTPSVINTWVEFRSVTESSDSHIERAKILDKMLCAIRDDLGVANKSLPMGTLISLVIKKTDNVVVEPSLPQADQIGIVPKTMSNSSIS